MRFVAVITLVLAIAAQSIVPVAAQKSAKTRSLTEEQRIVHVLNRLGFGARPGDVERVKAMGLENYINQQLSPAKIADTVAENRVKDLAVLNMTTAELYEKYPQPGLLLRQLQASPKHARTGSKAAPTPCPPKCPRTSRRMIR